MKQRSSPIVLFFFDKENKAKNIALLVWISITLFCVIQSLITHRYNNYHIFENTFRNLIQQTSLYAAYPDFHFDENHYGPIFSVFFMPFALLPNAYGFLVWNIFNCLILFKAIETIPIKNRSVLYYIAIPTMVSASLSQQLTQLWGHL